LTSLSCRFNVFFFFFFSSPPKTRFFHAQPSFLIVRMGPPPNCASALLRIKLCSTASFSSPLWSGGGLGGPGVAADRSTFLDVTQTAPTRYVLVFSPLQTPDLFCGGFPPPPKNTENFHDQASFPCRTRNLALPPCAAWPFWSSLVQDGLGFSVYFFSFVPGIRTGEAHHQR